MIELDEVIREIRYGDLILWVGSGFSKIAGYPTGSELASIIIKTLNRNEKRYFKNRVSLEDVAEEFVQMRSREELIAILNDIFKKEPTNLAYHQILSEIPQIQTIITTNYDKSFELTYRAAISTVISDKDIPLAIRDKVHLYKVHGDIDAPNSIIITKKDYSDYYNEGRESLLWTEIRSLVSKYSVLFIGYSFEDSNIKSIFEDILKRLGNSHKNYYLITRNLPDYKKHHLLDQYSIRYIRMSAEEAIINIKKEIERNLIIDAQNGCIPNHLIPKVFKERKISTEFSIAEEGKLDLKTIGPLEGGPQVQYNISLTFPIEKSSKIHEFIEVVSGNIFENCVLSQDDCIINISAKIGEIILLDPKYDKTSSFMVSSVPTRSFYADLLLNKSCIFFNKLKTELYSSSSAFKIIISHSNFDLTIKSLNTKKTGLTISFNVHPVKNVMQGYEFYRFLNTWIEEDELRIHLDFCDKPFIIPFSKLNFEEKQIQTININYEYYSKFFRIQREFGVIFNNLDQVKDHDLNTLNKITYLLDGGKLPLENNISYSMKILDKNKFLTSLDEELVVIKIGPIPYFCTVLGIIIILGCDIHLSKGFVANKQEVISKLAEGFEDINVTMKSKSNTCFLLYGGVSSIDTGSN